MTPIVKLAHLSMKLYIELLVITSIKWSKSYLSKSVHKDKFPHSWRLETCRFAECHCRMPICAVAPCCAPSYRRTLTLQRALQRAAVCSLRGRDGYIHIFHVCSMLVYRPHIFLQCSVLVYRPHIFPVCSMTGLMNCSAFIITATCSIHTAALQNTELVSAAALSIEKIVIFGSRSNTTIYYKNYSFISLSSTQQYNNTIIAGWMAGLHLNHTHIDNLFS